MEDERAAGVKLKRYEMEGNAICPGMQKNQARQPEVETGASVRIPHRFSEGQGSHYLQQFFQEAEK